MKNPRLTRLARGLSGIPDLTGFREYRWLRHFGNNSVATSRKPRPSGPLAGLSAQ